MPTELLDSRDVSVNVTSASIKRRYLVTATDPEVFLNDPSLPMIGSSHFVYPQYKLMGIEVARYSKTDDVCQVILTWETRSFLPREEWEWDIATRSVHITSVIDLDHAAHYPEASDCGVLIGLNGDKVDGVDVLRANATLRVKKVWLMPPTPDQINLIGELLYHVNTYTWFNYLPGQILFTKARITMMDNGEHSVEYMFEIKPTPAEQYFDLIDGDFVTFTPASSFDYIWTQVGETVTEGGSIVGTKSVHVAQVYEYADLGLLDLYGPY